MTAFKPGAKVLIPATVRVVLPGGDVCEAEIDGIGRYCFPTDTLLPAPEPPYVEPELVPGMVVMSKDESDDRQWHYLPSGPGDTEPFRTVHKWLSRGALPEYIRPVFDPREVTT